MRLEARPRFLFYSHDGMGLGHTRRNLTIAQAVRELVPEASVLLATSAEGLELFSIPNGVDVLGLPGLRKVTNGNYVPRRLPDDSAEVISLRSRLLAAAVDGFRPSVLLTDKHPGGVQGELLGALDALRGYGGRAVLGLRDVLDDPVEAADQWRSDGLTQLIEDRFELVLVYGSREVLDPLPEGLLSDRVVSRCRYCGYVVTSRGSGTPVVAVDEPGACRVLATAGGGADGMLLLTTFVEACSAAPWKGILVAGPQLSEEEWVELQAKALRAGVTPYRAVPRLNSWIGEVNALVCMGGYNTLAEAIAAGTPTVCFPRVWPRTEQLIRARGFAALGLIQMVEPEEFTSLTLANAIQQALARPPNGPPSLDLQGAHRAAQLLVDLASPHRLSAMTPRSGGM
jgi:predicted glycosyltransferase